MFKPGINNYDRWSRVQMSRSVGLTGRDILGFILKLMLKFMWVKLHIVAHAWVFLFLFYITYNPYFKLRHDYGAIGMFWAK